MKADIRTVYGTHLQTAQYLNLPYEVKDHTTLNEKFNVFANQHLGENEMPSVAYIGIGNGGHTVVTGTGGIPLLNPIQHTARHAALYNQIPFIMRKVSDDLIPTERAKYRLRRLETYDGVQYAVYYLKVIDLSETIPGLELRKVNGDITTITEFIPTLDDLNPVAPNITSGGVIISSGDYVAASARVPFILNETEIAEIMNACNIIYGDPNYAIISEIAVCSGVDRNLTGSFNGINTGYTDAVAVQIANFVSAMYPLPFLNKEVNTMLDVGASEPMMNLS